METLVGLLIIVGLVVFLIKKEEKKQKKEKEDAARIVRIRRKSQENIEKWKQFGLPLVEHPYFLLQKDEKLYSHAAVVFKKPGFKTKRIEKFPATYVKVSKGLSFRIPAQEGESVKEPYLAEEIEGNLFLTNKRLVFNGTRNISYQLNKIAVVECAYNSLAILKENEKIVKFFVFPNEETANTFTDMISFLLGRAIKRTYEGDKGERVDSIRNTSAEEPEIEVINNITKEEIIKTLLDIKGYNHVNWVVLKNSLQSASKATQMLEFLRQEHFVQSTEGGYVPHIGKIEQYLNENTNLTK